MRYTTSDGVSIAYDIYGTGENLVLLHGALVDRAYWQPQLAELSQHFRVVIPDLRWNAFNAPIDYNVKRMARDILDLLDTLNIEQTHICGHALGGSVAVQLALAKPMCVDKLVLLETLPEYPLQGIFLNLLKTTIKLTPIGMLARSMRNLTSNEDCKAYIVEEVKILGKEKYFALLQAQIDYEFKTKLSQIKHATMLVRGTSESPLSKPTAVMVSRMPNAQVRVIPSAGHMANWDNTPAFNQAVLDHLMSDDDISAPFRHAANANP